MVEGSPELVQLLLGDALCVSSQNLVLDLIDGAGDGGEQLLPAHADVLQKTERGEFRGSSWGAVEASDVRA